MVNLCNRAWPRDVMLHSKMGCSQMLVFPYHKTKLLPGSERHSLIVVPLPWYCSEHHPLVVPGSEHHPLIMSAAPLVVSATP